MGGVTTEGRPPHDDDFFVLGGNAAAERAVDLGDWEAWFHLEPHGGGEAGGDVVFLRTAAKRLTAVLADVSGHGTDAAAAGGRFAELVASGLEEPEPGRLLATLNEEVSAAGIAPRLASVVAIAVDRTSGRLAYACGGATGLLHLPADGGLRIVLAPAVAEGPANLDVGVLADTLYPEGAFDVGPGDLVVLLSDGWFTARDPEGRIAGEAVLPLLEGAPRTDVAAFAAAFAADHRARYGAAAAADDVSAFALRRRPVRTASPSPPRG